MADQVFKYPLDVTDVQDITTHDGAELLCVQMNRDQPCMWVRVDTTKPKVKRRIFMHGTGHDIHKDATRFVGTFQMRMGTLVFHVFDSQL